GGPAALDGLSSTFVDLRPDLEAAFTRLGQLEMIHPVGRPPRPAFGDGQMLTAWLHVTNACNLRCPYCYVNKSAEKMDDSVGYAAVEAVGRGAVRAHSPAGRLK